MIAKFFFLKITKNQLKKPEFPDKNTFAVQKGFILDDLGNFCPFASNH